MKDKVTITGGIEHVYLSQKTRSKLWQLAKELDVARNQIIREAIEAYLGEDENGKPNS